VGNVPAGSKNGEIIRRAKYKDHAQTNAADELKNLPSGCFVYVKLQKVATPP